MYHHQRGTVLLLWAHSHRPDLVLVWEGNITGQELVLETWEGKNSRVNQQASRLKPSVAAASVLASKLPPCTCEPRKLFLPRFDLVGVLSQKQKVTFNSPHLSPASLDWL